VDDWVFVVVGVVDRVDLRFGVPTAGDFSVGAVADFLERWGVGVIFFASVESGTNLLVRVFLAGFFGTIPTASFGVDFALETDLVFRTDDGSQKLRVSVSEVTDTI